MKTIANVAVGHKERNVLLVIIYKITFFTAFFVLTKVSFSFSNIPDPLEIDDDSKIIFIDFLHATYHLNYDVNKKRVQAISEIVFEQNEFGKPVIDMVDEPEAIYLNGKSVDSKVFALKDSSTSFRYINVDLPKGIYDIRIVSLPRAHLKISKRGVYHLFLMNDLQDRTFLEKYLPSNLEYDLYPMKFVIEIFGTSMPHNIFTNGIVMEIETNKWEIQYPVYFSASSVYYHLGRSDKFDVLNTKLTSVDGRGISLQIYSKKVKYLDLNKFYKKTLKIITKLEEEYGAFPHSSLTIYAISGGWGMEYCGATITGMRALSHELFHSYLARGVMPVNGRAGWVDESIACWRDRKYRVVKKLNISSTKLAWDSPYTRITNRKAYNEGEQLMAHLQYLLEKSDGDMKDFLRDYFKNNMHERISSDGFQDDLERFFNSSFQRLFDKYIYGKSGISHKRRNKILDTNKIFHRIISPVMVKEVL